MITDCELLELAAKAAGYTTKQPWNAEPLPKMTAAEPDQKPWKTGAKAKK